MIRYIYSIIFLCVNIPIFATTYTASTGNWSSLTWSPAGPPGATDDIVIPTGVTVTMDADYTTTGSLTLQGTGTIEMSGYNLTAGSLTATGAAIINNSGAVAVLTVGSANTNTSYTGVLTGAVSFTKSGTGTLTLSGSNAFTGSITITNSGTNTLTISGTNTYSGNTSIINGSSGGTTFSGANTFFGTTTMTNNGGSNITFSIGSTFEDDISVTVFGTGSVKLANTSGTTLFKGNIVFNRTNTSSHQANGLYFGASGGSSSLADGKTITCNTAAWLEFTNFTQIGTTPQVINASSNGSPFGAVKFYSGTVFNAPLTVTTTSLGLSGGTFNNTTIFHKSGGGDNGASGGVTLNGATTIKNTSGGGKLDLSVSPTLNNTLSIEGTKNINFLAAFANGGNLITVNSTSSISFAGVISGSGGISQIGSGQLVLSGTNTYTGVTTISAGYLSLGNTSALGNISGGTVVESGGALDLNGVTYALEEPITISGTGVASTGAIRNNSATGATLPGLITLAANSSIFGASGTITLSNVGTITGSGFTLTLGGTVGGTVASIIGTGAGGITKSGTGTWTLTGANTYTGATSISAGILKLGSTSSLGTNASGTTITSGAALDLNGNTLSSAEALTISGTGVSVGGALINTGSAASYSGAITLGAATTITTANNITLSGTISPSTYTLSKAGAASLNFDNNTVTLNGLTISAGTLNAGNATLNLSGTVSNSGTFTCGTSTVNLVGTAAQNLPALTFYNLTLNNTTSPATSASTLTGNLVIGGTLTLTTGILNTSTYSIDLGANGSISESNPSVLAPTSYVTGYVTATRDIGSSSGTVTFGGIGVEIAESNESNNSTLVTRRTGTASSGAGKTSILRYFDITPNVDVNLNATMVFHYTTAEIGSQTEANLRIYKANSPYSSWTRLTSTVDASTNTVSVSGITDFSRWTASDYVNQALPVDFVKFVATKESDKIKLSWTTANEIDNDYFEIERSLNGIDFKVIDVVKGAGTKSSSTNYAYIDLNSSQKVYYRLKQVDLDKKSTYSSIVQIEASELKHIADIFPNPLKEGETLNLKLDDENEDNVKILIFDLSGRMLHDYQIQNVNNQFNFRLDKVNSLLKKGIYMIEIRTASNNYIQRLEVE